MRINEEKTTILAFPIATYRVKDIAWTLAFTIAAVLLPALLAHTPHNQWITGTIVNAILFLAVWRVGIANTVLVAILPSSVALSRGLLPAPMAVLIPYIILSNILLISVFYFTSRTWKLSFQVETKFPSLLFAMFSASIAKFLFLFAITSYFVKVATPLLVMMHWPQFFTALAGGLIALGIVELFKKNPSH
ncbi:MAG: hypothetical protein QMD77_04250 [Patescibacteria group bacterium]|nr:hypothetical protein [Patescibacteria group bacterium]